MNFKITTKEDFPGSPKNLKTFLIKPDLINIGWGEPDEPNGEILGYTYNYTGTPIDQNQTDIYIHSLGATLG